MIQGGKWVRAMRVLPPLFAAASGIVCASSTHAALRGRDILGNRVAANDASSVFEYDTDLNITWLRDWNYGAGSSFDDGDSTTDGAMTWFNALAWAADLKIGSFDGWRLPHADPGCYVHHCTASEMGHLYYLELGNKAGNLTNRGPFVGMEGLPYHWTDTSATSGVAYIFGFGPGGRSQDVGLQVWGQKYWPRNIYAVAVRPGDVAAVPEPQTYAMLLLGLGAVMVGVRRRPA